MHEAYNLKKENNNNENAGECFKRSITNSVQNSGFI